MENEKGGLRSTHSLRDNVMRRAHRNLSMPLHSRTVISQNPRRNASEDAVLEIVSSISASSPASACCTNGLSDIQKPEHHTKCQIFHTCHRHPTMKRRRKNCKQRPKGLTIENAFPKLGHFGFWQRIARRIREKRREVLDSLISCFLVLAMRKSDFF